MLRGVRKLALGLAILTASGAAAAASFQGLGFLPGYTTESEAFGVSADGTTVAGVSAFFDFINEVERQQGYRWTAAGGMQGIGDLPGGFQASYGLGISGDGSVVVGRSYPSTNRPKAVRWTSATGLVDIGALPGHLSSFAEDASYDGSVIVGVSAQIDVSGSADRGFRWTASGGIVDIGDLPGGDLTTRALAVSPNGRFVVGNSASANGTEAFLWSDTAGMIGLGDLVSTSFMSFANDVSDDGTIVVGSRGTGRPGQQQHITAWRWTALGGMQALTDPTGVFTGRTIATAISGDGSVIVGVGTTAFAFEDPFIWTATTGMRRLKDVLVNQYGLTAAQSWNLGTPTGISTDGRTIVGTGFHINNRQAWIATIPEPHSALLLGMGLAALARLRPREA
jgi:probable HAF family extracellular repeat protein